MDTKKPATIEKTMMIADIIHLVPESAELMLEAGLHCIGCHANPYETLEEGMLGHGYIEKDIDALVQKINYVYTKQTTPATKKS